ncbi:MAG TPA: hypothetical protein VE757_02820, partial [Gaiellaceae bacterium]|nr:hypothetical protein [Gaiellaceae bacterium]
AYALIRDSSRILMEAAPGDAAPAEVADAMLAVPGVVEVHDLHVWTVGSGFPSLSAHALVEPGADCHAIRLQLAEILRERFGLGHSTLQVEHARAPASSTGLPLVRR